MDKPRHRIDPDRLEHAFAVVRAAVERDAVPSAVLTIANRDELIRLETVQPPGGEYKVRPDSIYLLASISKPIVASAIMRLVERGQIRLNDPIASVFPEFAQNGKAAVTLWHLLTHSSGLDETFTEPLYHQKRPAADGVAGMMTTGLLFPPGTRYSYNNVGFFVMGELVRRLTDLPLGEYLRREVFDPLGMIDTFFTPSEKQRKRMPPVLRATDFDVDYYVTLAHPAGGLYSTAADLVRFAQAFLPGRRKPKQRLLGPATIAAMTALHTNGLLDHNQDPPANAFYGLGWGKNGLDRRWEPSLELSTTAGFGHSGATGTYLWIEPDYDLIFVFLTNSWGVDATAVRKSALNAALGALVEA